MDLVDDTGTSVPKTAFTARLSIRSFGGVAVPWALM